MNNEFNPSPEATFAFNQMFNPQPEISPVGGYAGTSHFGYVRPLHPETVNPGWHVTTEIPGLKQGQTISVHDQVNDMFDGGGY